MGGLGGRKNLIILDSYSKVGLLGKVSVPPWVTRRAVPAPQLLGDKKRYRAAPGLQK